MYKTKSYYPTIGQAWLLLLVIIGFTLATAALMVAATAIFPGLNRENEVAYSAMELAVYIVMLGATILYARHQLRKDNSNETARPRLNPIVIILAFVLTPALMVLLDPVSALMPVPQWFKEIIGEVIKPNIFSFLAIGIAPAILEEILFRGIVLKGMLRNYSPAKAIFWSSFFFGIFHLNPWQALPAILIGIFLGWLYYRTRSLLPGMIIHGVNNSLSFLFAIYYPEMDDTLLSFVGLKTFAVLFIAATAIFVVGYIVLNKLMPDPVRYTPPAGDIMPFAADPAILPPSTGRDETVL